MRSVFVFSLCLVGCTRPLVYYVPVLVPPAPVQTSQRVQACRESLQRAVALNTGYLKKIRKATSYRPTVVESPGLPEDQYYATCMNLLGAIGMSNAKLRTEIESRKRW